MSKVLDCIVLGVGGMGSAALYYAAKRGWNTLGLDRFGAAHDRGSSHGRTRIIRQAYFEHPDYVPLLLDAYQRWAEIEERAGQTLFEKTGLLQVGCPDGPIIQGIRKSVAENELSIRELSAEQLKREYPVFQFRDRDVGLFEENAGFLHVECCVQAFIDLAISAGAEFRHDAQVTGWSASPQGFRVESNAGSWSTRRLIIAVGAWAADLMPAWKDRLQVIAKHQHWFRIADDRTKLDAGFPSFFFETDEGYFYGFPDFDGHGNKIAEHSGGTQVPDPLTVKRELDERDLRRVQHFADHYLNAPRGIHHDHSLCMYTMSPDEHFIVDAPEPGLACVCGMSGHGFKFAPVIGQALVDMVEGKFREDMSFLKADRLV